MERAKAWLIVAGVVFVMLIATLSYGTLRSHTLALMLQYCVLFVLYGYMMYRAQAMPMWYWLVVAVVARISLLALTPNLSDDVYRFLWDGELLAHGIHPFAHTPAWHIANQTPVESLPALYAQLNSPSYYTVYPPVLQYIFLAVVSVTDSTVGGIVVLRLLIVLAELGTLWLLIQLLRQSGITITNSLVYALNPLIIIELTGNLHPEAFMITALLACFYFIQKNKMVWAAVCFSFGVLIKLIPLLLVPALAVKLGGRKFAIGAVVSLACMACFVTPLWDVDLIIGFKNSLRYYFQKFEFNASIYFIVRSVGYWWYGYNIIQQAGVVLSVVSTVCIVGFTLKRWRDCDETTAAEFAVLFLGCNTLYLLFATTVHPWYIAPLLACSAITRFRFPVIWSLLIFFTYAGYTPTGYQENFFIVSMEYIVVLCAVVFELKQKKLPWPEIA